MVSALFAAILLQSDPASAQTFDARAQDAIDGADTGGALFTETRRNKALAPFEETTPEALDLDPEELEDRALQASLGQSIEAGIYDLYRSRRPMVMEPDDPRLSNGIWATTIGVDLMGDLEDGADRSCTFRDFGAVPPITRICERFTDFTEGTCEVRLEVVDGQPRIVADECLSMADDNRCRSAGFTCTAPDVTLDVDGAEVAFPCGVWDQLYICEGDGFIGDCAPYDDNPACTPIETVCLATHHDGSCAEEDVTFSCGNPDAEIDQACSAVQVCIGDVCEGAAVEASEDFAAAAAHINLAAEAVDGVVRGSASCTATEDGQDCTSGTVRFFDGKRETCERFGILGSCCTRSGLVNSLFGCNARQVALSEAAGAGRVYGLGDYCAVSFLVCLERRYAFCVFDTKLARVFHEEVREATGARWEGPEDEACDGLRVSDLDEIDLAELDFSEVFEDYEPSGAGPDRADLEVRLVDRINLAIEIDDATADPVRPDPENADPQTNQVLP